MTLSEHLRSSAGRHSDRTAVVAGERRLSFAELDGAADAVAGRLHTLGVRRGDRVAVVLPNGAAVAPAIYGVLRCGAAFTPIGPATKPRRLADLLARCGAAAVICEPAGEAAARAAGAPRVLALAPQGIEPAAPVLAAPPEPGEDDLAAIIWTSGSTGEPKGAAFAHRNMSFVADSIVSYLGLGPADRILCPLPLSHTYGLYHLIMAVRVGATLVLESGLSYPGRLVDRLERERITFLPGVPTTWQVLTSLPGLRERPLPHLRTLTNAGAALSAAQVARVRETFPGARLFSMYGQTECKRVCFLPPEELDARPGSVGIAIPGTEAWVEGARGGRAAPGEVGELLIRGEHVMTGYWGDPEATAGKVGSDGTLRSGDLFRTDADGYLYFVARRDDIIKSRGEKVAPREVEEVLQAAAGVREAAVVGAPDELLGQAVIAHVSALEGDVLDPRALRRHCAEHLDDHKVPRTVVVHAELPRTDSGKLDKASLSAYSSTGS